MALYESVFIARQDISSSQVDALADSFQKIIEDGGGQVPKREYWGLRSLAYKIKKNRKGHYVLFNIDSPSAAVLEYERYMKLNEDILRYMTLRVDELDPEPSVVMQGRGRSDRGDRGDRGRRFEERPRDGNKPPEAAKTGEAEPDKTKADKPAEAAKPDAEAAVEKAPKSAAKETDGDKKEDAGKKESKPAKSEESAPDAEKADDKKAKKAAPAKKDAPAKEDKKPASVKTAAAAKKKGEEA